MPWAISFRPVGAQEKPDETMTKAAILKDGKPKDGKSLSPNPGYSSKSPFPRRGSEQT
ncbi:hypothetical protein CCP4SC76_3960004 [Gammaproteobacteria bacterium]